MAENAFRDNVVVITGASTGIGRALAYALAAQGARLALAARDAAALEAVATEVRQRGGQALVVPTDVAQQEQCRALIERTVEAFGAIDTLINNAGVTMWARFDELQALGPVEQIMRVNYFGSVYCTFYALPYLKQSRGRLVGVSSLAGKGGVPTRSAYAGSKHAMAGFFDSLRIELMGSGVSVTMAYPDFVSSEIRARAFGPDGGPLKVSPVQEGKVMSAETCAALIVDAAAHRRREVVMGLRGKVSLWLRLIAPSLVDRIALNAIRSGK